jgi:hypothetical protein
LACVLRNQVTPLFVPRQQVVVDVCKTTSSNSD